MLLYLGLFGIWTSHVDIVRNKIKFSFTNNTILLNKNLLVVGIITGWGRHLKYIWNDIYEIFGLHANTTQTWSFISNDKITIFPRFVWIAICFYQKIPLFFWHPRRKRFLILPSLKNNFIYNNRERKKLKRWFWKEILINFNYPNRNTRKGIIKHIDKLNRGRTKEKEKRNN